MDKKYLNSMFENLLHIGNKSNFWNPRMRKYIYGSVNGVHVINLIESAKKIEEVKAELKKLTSEGKRILFVGTKLQAQDPVRKLAKDTGNYYVCEKWVPGLLTNFKTIKRRIATYVRLLEDDKKGTFDVLTKKEKAQKLLELDKLNKAFIGVKEMKKLPDAVFIVDGEFEKQAIKEANNLNLPVYAVLNTNGDELTVTNCIPANTNAVKSIEFIVSELQGEVKVNEAAASKGNAKAKKVAVKPASGARKGAPKVVKKSDKVEEKQAEAIKTTAKKVEKVKEETKKEEK